MRPVASFLRRETVPICDHQKYSSATKMDQQVYQQDLLVETMSPLGPSVGLFSSNNGPSQGLLQHFLVGTWAHSWPLAAFLHSNDGPIQGYWQHFLVGTLCPFMAIHRQPFSAAIIGPFKGISRITCRNTGCIRGLQDILQQQ